MASIGDVWLRLGLEGTRLEADAKRLGAKAGDAAGSAMSIGIKAKLSDVFKGGGVFGIGAALGASATGVLNRALSGTVGFFQDSITAASDLNETLSKSRVVFGDSASEVLAWGRTTATAIGISQNQALAAAGTYGNLFVSMGLAGDKAATMSVRMVQLAADLASFNNASPEEALAAIQSGLVGETEPLRKFGVNLNDAALRQKALALGLVKTTSTVLPAAIRAQAAYALILEQSGTAQGDFARTSDGFASQQRIVAAEMADLSATIGAELLPAFLSMEQELVKIIPQFKEFVAAADLATGKLDEVAGGSKAAAEETDILGSKTTPLGQALHLAADAMGVTVLRLQDLADGGHRVDEMFASQKAAVTDARNNMIGLGDDYRASVGDATAVAEAFDTVGAKAGDMAAAIAAAGVTAAQSVENMRNRIVKAAQGVIDGAYGNITTADSLSATNAEINAQRRIIAMGGASGGTDRATAALDRQSKALDRASEAEKRRDDASETIFQRTMKRLSGEYQAQLDALDLAEKQNAIADRRRDLNEQLNQAQLDLGTAQGGTDAGAISAAMKNVADIQAQQAENERRLTVDTQRDRLRATQDYIESIAKLEADNDDKKSLANTLRKRDAKLTGELAVAQAAKDADKIKDITAKLEAVQTAEERTAAALRSRSKADELAVLKAQLEEQRKAISSSGSATVADAKARLHELYQTQAEEVLSLATAGKLGSQQVADALVDMKKRLETATGDERIAIDATIQALKDLQAQAERTFVNLPGGGSVPRPVGAPGGPQARDRGDPVVPGTSGAVGASRRPAVVVPGQRGSGTLQSTAMGAWTAGGGVIEVTVVSQLDGHEVARSTSRILASELHH